MTMRGRLRGRASFDIVVCSLLIVASGLAFLVVGLIRLATEGGPSVLDVPIVVFLLEGGAGIAVLTGLRPARPVILTILVLAALLHMVITLGEGFTWTRVVSGVLVAANIYALVLCNTRPVRVHFGLDS